MENERETVIILGGYIKVILGYIGQRKRKWKLPSEVLEKEVGIVTRLKGLRFRVEGCDKIPGSPFWALKP